MRESLGTTFNLTALFIFIVLVTGFILFGMNYYRAFGVKNKIVSTIEQYEGNLTSDKLRNEIDDYINRANYHIPENNIPKQEEYWKCVNEQGWCYMIEHQKGTKKYVYKVKTFVNIDIPFFNKIFGFLNFFAVSGETKPIKRS